MRKPVRHSLLRFSVGVLTFMILALLPVGVAAETLTGRTLCGPYTLHRSGGSFTLTVCGGGATISGTYAGSAVQVTRVRAGGFTVRTDLAFTASAPGWEDLVIQLAALGQGVARSAALAQELGLDKSLEQELRTSSGGTNLNFACDPSDTGLPVHVFRGPVYGNLRVQPGCVAIALAPLDLDDLIVEGWLYVLLDMEAETATIRSIAGVGGTLSTFGSFTAPTVVIEEGSLEADGVSVHTLKAEGGRVEAGRAFTAGGAPAGGDGLVELSGGASLSTQRFTAGRVMASDSALATGETNIPDLVLNRATLTGGKTEITRALLNGGTIQAGTTRIDTVQINSGSVKAGDLTVQQILAAPGRVEATALTARTGPALVRMTGSPDGAGMSTLDAGRIDVTTLDLARTKVTATEVSAETLALIDGHMSGGLSVDVQGSMVTRDTGVSAGEALAISAGTLRMTRGDVTADGRIAITVAQKTELAAIRMAAPRIDAALAEGTVDAASLFTADAGGLGQQMGEFPSGRSVTEEERRPVLTGASYGGYGGTSGDLDISLFNVASAPVGSPLTPSEEGGLGGFGLDPNKYHALPASPEGGRGGGVIRIGAASLAWDGKAAANGGSGSRGQGGAAGGSGGSITVEVSGQLSGTGEFETNGGHGGFRAWNFTTAGGGSGGRIRIGYGTLAGNGLKARSLGGRGGGAPDARTKNVPSWQDWRNHAGPGTVYWKPAGQPGTIVIDNTGGPGGVGALSGAFPEDRVEIRNAIVATTGLRVHSLTIRDGGVLAADHPRLRLHWPPPTAYAGSDHVRANQQIYPTWVVRDRLERRVTIQAAGDVAVEQGGRIDLTGAGGFSRGEDLSPPLTGVNRAGGSHGGMGGTGRLRSIGRPTPVFGNPDEPTGVGAGGFGDDLDAVNFNCGLGGAGGGALRLAVGGVLTVNGWITVGGAPGTVVKDCFSTGGTGGGAGGSVWITARALRGNGVVSASGGSGAYFDGTGGGQQSWGGGGGGGRVAVYADLGQFAGQILAEGGLGAAGGGVAPETYRGQSGSVVRGAPPAPVGGASGTTDRVRITLEGAELKSDVPAHLRDGRTMIPFRALLEALGAEVGYDAATRTVSAIRQGIIVRLVIGRNQATVNGKLHTLDVAPYVLEGRTFVPVRFVSEQLGFKVGWDAATRTVSITR